MFDLETDPSPGCEFPWGYVVPLLQHWLLALPIREDAADHRLSLSVLLLRSTPGPEDPRLIWSPEGVPLMIVGMDTIRPEACRTMGVMDLRVFWPDLKMELDRLGWPATAGSAAGGKFGAGKGADVQERPLERGTEVWFDGIGEREKKYVPLASYGCALEI